MKKITTTNNSVFLDIVRIDPWLFQDVPFDVSMQVLVKALEGKFPKAGSHSPFGLWFEHDNKEISIGPWGNEIKENLYAIYVLALNNKKFTKRKINAFKKDILSAFPKNTKIYTKLGSFEDNSLSFGLVLDIPCSKEVFKASQNAKKLKQTFITSGLSEEDTKSVINWYKALYKNMGIVIFGKPEIK